MCPTWYVFPLSLKKWQIRPDLLKGQRNTGMKTIYTSTNLNNWNLVLSIKNVKLHLRDLNTKYNVFQLIFVLKTPILEIYNNLDAFVLSYFHS